MKNLVPINTNMSKIKNFIIFQSIFVINTLNLSVYVPLQLKIYEEANLKVLI